MDEPSAKLHDNKSSRGTVDPPSGGVDFPHPGPTAPPDLYRALLESMTEGVSLSTEEGIIVYTNPAEDRMFGYAPGELIGCHVSVQNAYPEDENQHRVAEVIVHLKNHGHWEGEWLNRRKDGQEFITASRITAVEVNGRAHWLCVQRDVTAQRRADAARQEAADELRRMSDAMPTLLAWVGSDQCYRMVNAAYERWFGQSRDEIVGRSIRDLLGDEAYAAREAQIAAVLRGEPQRFEAFAPHSDGNRRETELHYVPRRDTSGRLDGFYVHVEDITDRRLAEERLRASEERLRLAAEAAQIGTWDLDLTTGVGRWDEAAMKIGGLSKNEPGYDVDTWLRLVHPEDRERVGAAFQACLEPDGPHYDVEFRCAVPADDGGARWVTSHGAVFREPASGRAVRAVGILRDVTARRRDQERVLESEGRLRLAQDAGGIGLWDWNIRTGAVVWSEGYYRVWGIDPSVVPSLEGFISRVDPDQRPELEASIRSALLHAGPWSTEMRVPGEGGQVRWIAARGEFRHNERGEPERMIGVCFDITDRKTAEEELRQSEQRLQLAKQAARIGVWDWDLTNNQITWSPEMHELLGIDPATPAGELFGAWTRVLHPEDREEAERIARRGAIKGEPFSIDVRVIHSDGAVRWIRSQATAVLGPDGRPTRLTGINLDVTAQHHQEEQLREKAQSFAVVAEERTRERDRLFELSSDLFAVAGFDGYLKTINPAWPHLLGYTEAELLERPFIEIIHPEDHAAVADAITKMRRGDAVQRFEDRLVRRDGQSVLIAWTAVPEGEFFYAVGRDVTREREREEALRQAQKMEAVGQLTGGISHDFNNLLGAVMGGFDLIRRKPNDPQRVIKLAEHGLAAAERGAKLTSRLLAFSRAQRIEMKPLIVADVLMEMRDLLDRTLGPLVQLTLELDNTQVPVLSDKIQLEMAILNLAINARDAMPNGGRVTISTRLSHNHRDATLMPGEYVELVVADTGVGMPPEVVARAFDPFFTTKDVGKGTGLGLSQVYGIARQAGGTVRIDSRPGAGTKVRMVLPRSNGGPGSAEVGQSTGEVLDAARGTVLVIDDDADLRRVLVASLDALGYRVLEAENGLAGLEKLGRQVPDVIIVDFAMPEMNGAEVARAIRERHPDLPIIFASGYADTAAIENVAGPNAPVLHKPFRLDDLQAALSKALIR